MQKCYLSLFEQEDDYVFLVSDFLLRLLPKPKTLFFDISRTSPVIIRSEIHTSLALIIKVYLQNMIILDRVISMSGFSPNDVYCLTCLFWRAQRPSKHIFSTCSINNGIKLFLKFWEHDPKPFYKWVTCFNINTKIHCLHVISIGSMWKLHVTFTNKSLGGYTK